ncbi:MULTISPECIES: ABC transporter ATP-binding protein [Oerskovia]|uniref:ABC transporter ATP-binding protein n=2 Tax=Oerskovia TaxID=162491 RepID=A0ABR8V3S8_9CELL|nr:MULTISPECIES: ABC transporter ATP-binding protein [Oerskovia]MBD7999216.1 ABC transporter ATP-binding protein [Oerskovia gallyi]MBM7498365.1 ABC-2 type transport system ATP-binding protein [Oerskovia paurometabola]
MSTTVVRVDNISKRFVIRKEKSLKERLVNFGRSNKHKDDFWALRDVDLDITSGSTVGLVGPNGSGKSTLLKMIGGILQPTSGTVSIRGRLAALLELGAGFHPDLTGRENVYLNASILGLSREQTDSYFDAIVDFSGIEKFIDTQVKFYSSGMYVRLAFAVAVHVDPDILLVDEVLAVGDEPFQRKCMDRIRQFQHDGRTIIFVSHSLDQVADLCDRAVVLESGAVIADGAPREALRTLRSEFDQIRQEDIEREQIRIQEAEQSTKVEDEPAHAVERAVVQSVGLFSPDGSPVSEISPATDVVVAVTVEASTPISGAIVGIGIDTALGVNVYGTNTKLLGVPLPRLEGTHRVEFLLPDLHIGEGSYALHGAVTNAAGSELHRLRDAVQLSVVADGRSVGVTWTNAQVLSGQDSTVGASTV